MFKTLIIISIYYFSLLNNISFSQDTAKTKTDTVKIPFTFIISENKYSYLSQVNPDTVTRKRFLWFPLKSFDDIFNYLPGYYLKTKDVGQINQFNYNKGFNTGVLRNGRPINDMMDGSIDLNLLSRNEIAEIETSNGFGNSVYDYSNNVNIIQRQQFQYRPFTELAFWQDRYTNEYVDAVFSQNFFKGFNFNFGITKHSYDGKYTNSDFDKWLGRFNFNLAPSKNLNFFLYTNYAKIQRGLNGGIDPDTVDIGNKETMFNPTLAIVKNSDAYEIKERFDIDGGMIYQKGISFTKLQLYVSNSFRWYRDEENRLNSNGITIKYNTHWINYGIKLQEVLNFKLLKVFNIISRTEAEYNYEIDMFDYVYPQVIMQNNNWFTRDNIYLFENISFKYKNLEADGYSKLKFRFYLNSIYLYGQSGLKLSYNIKLDTMNSLVVSGMYNSIFNYFDAGISYKHGKNTISAKYFFYEYYSYNQTGTASDYYKISGINSAVALRLLNIDLDMTYNFNAHSESYLQDIYPVHSGNINLSYHNTGIKNKLEYKIGLSSRFWSKYYSSPVYSNNSVQIPSNATLDFFIIGKISRATFGLTFENILDRLIYNTGVYPAIDRGGLFNAWSRFNITWNFFD